MAMTVLLQVSGRKTQQQSRKNTVVLVAEITPYRVLRPLETIFTIILFTRTIRSCVTRERFYFLFFVIIQTPPYFSLYEIPNLQRVE